MPDLVGREKKRQESCAIAEVRLRCLLLTIDYFPRLPNHKGTHRSFQRGGSGGGMPRDYSAFNLG